MTCCCCCCSTSSLKVGSRRTSCLSQACPLPPSLPGQRRPSPAGRLTGGRLIHVLAALPIARLDTGAVSVVERLLQLEGAGGGACGSPAGQEEGAGTEAHLRAGAREAARQESLRGASLTGRRSSGFRDAARMCSWRALLLSSTSGRWEEESLVWGGGSPNQERRARLCPLPCPAQDPQSTSPGGKRRRPFAWVTLCSIIPLRHHKSEEVKEGRQEYAQKAILVP